MPDYTSVTLHPETVELVDTARPGEYISRAQWVNGTMWRFYGHLLTGDRQVSKLNERERIAVAILAEEGDVDFGLLAKAFGVSEPTVTNVWQAHKQNKSDTTDAE